MSGGFLDSPVHLNMDSAPRGHARSMARLGQRAVFVKKELQMSPELERIPSSRSEARLLKKYQQRKLDSVRKSQQQPLGKKLSLEAMGDRPVEDVIERELQKKYRQVQRKVVYDRLTRQKRSVETVSQELMRKGGASRRKDSSCWWAGEISEGMERSQSEERKLRVVVVAVRPESAGKKKSDWLRDEERRTQQEQAAWEAQTKLRQESEAKVAEALRRAEEAKKERIAAKTRKDKEAKQAQTENLLREELERQTERERVMGRLALEEQKLKTQEKRREKVCQAQKDRRDKRLLRSKINKVLIEETPHLCVRHSKHEHRLHEMQEKVMLSVNSPTQGEGLRPRFMVRSVRSYNILPRGDVEQEHNLSPDEALVKHLREGELQTVSEDPNYFIKDKEKREQISLFEFLAEDEPFFESAPDRPQKESVANIKQKFMERKRLARSASMKKSGPTKVLANLHEKSPVDLITPLKDRVEGLREKNKRRAQEHEEGMELRKRDREIESKDLETRFYEKQRQADQNRRNEFRNKEVAKSERKKRRFEKELRIGEQQQRQQAEEQLIQEFLPAIFSNMRNHQVSASKSKEINRRTGPIKEHLKRWAEKMRFKQEREQDLYTNAQTKASVQQDMARLQRERHHKEAAIQLGKMKARVTRIVDNALDFLNRLK